MNQIFKQLHETKIVPVIALNRADDALPLADALAAGGIPAAEITFRTPAAEESIRRIAENRPDIIVGAGTVINVEQAERAVAAGARFLVSPGISRSVCEYAANKGILLFPGVCTPSEIMIALEYGIKVVKFFPAKQYGGLNTIKALAPVFPGLQFMPTGGVSKVNLAEYLSYDRVFACGGSWMVKQELIDAGRFDEITQIAKEAVEIANKVRS